MLRWSEKILHICTWNKSFCWWIRTLNEINVSQAIIRKACILICSLSWRAVQIYTFNRISNQCVCIHRKCTLIDNYIVIPKPLQWDCREICNRTWNEQSNVRLTGVWNAAIRCSNAICGHSVTNVLNVIELRYKILYNWLNISRSNQKFIHFWNIVVILT